MSDYSEYSRKKRWGGYDLHKRKRTSLTATSLIGGVLDKYRIRGDVRESRAVQAWGGIVGERIAARAWPHHIKEGVLLVAVENSSWMHQLSFMKDDIIAKINEAAGGPLVREVRLELAGRLNRRKGPDGKVVRPRVKRIKKKPPQATNPQHQRAIEADAGAVEDDELRAIIEKTRKRWDL
ncbi:MAG: DUF721 domain-containing protein [Deltaproteobacteria bacterium]|nr:DUF721 domain-containing protein [Deltaproteobacteria bacterium]